MAKKTVVFPRSSEQEPTAIVILDNNADFTGEAGGKPGKRTTTKKDLHINTRPSPAMNLMFEGSEKITTTPLETGTRITKTLIGELSVSSRTTRARPATSFIYQSPGLTFNIATKVNIVKPKTKKI